MMRYRDPALVNALVDRVARALYENASGPLSTWEEMPPERKVGWWSDAEIAVAIVIEEASKLADEPDPEKPSAYRLRREEIAPAIRGMGNSLGF